MNFGILNIFKNISLNSVVSTTNKALNVVKKSIPVYKEVRPYFNGEKKLMKQNNEVKEIVPKKSIINNNDTQNNNLTFFQ